MWRWYNTAFGPSSGENITFSISTFYCTCQRLCINIYAAKGNQNHQYSYVSCQTKKLKFFNFHTRRQAVSWENLLLCTLSLNFWGGKKYILRIFLGGIKFRESRTVHQVGFHAGWRGVWISVSWQMQIWMDCHQCWSDCNHGSRRGSCNTRYSFCNALTP